MSYEDENWVEHMLALSEKLPAKKSLHASQGDLVTAIYSMRRAIVHSIDEALVVLRFRDGRTANYTLESFMASYRVVV